MCLSLICVAAGHPCVCGEQRKDGTIGERNSGSSLRVRGTDLAVWLLEGLGRVIPACAGNRASHVHRKTPKSGHPCVCGEQGNSARHDVDANGSSLRVRGTDCLSWCAIKFSCQIQPL